MFMYPVRRSVSCPFSGFGYPGFCHLRRDTGEYRCGGFFVTILHKHKFPSLQKCRNKTVLFELSVSETGEMDPQDSSNNLKALRMQGRPMFCLFSSKVCLHALLM
jgi:hypothetical protein